MVEHWLNFFLPSSCFTANNRLQRPSFHLWAVLSPPITMAQRWQPTPCLSRCGLRPFSDTASPISRRPPTQFCILKWDWQGKTRDLISLPSTLHIAGWCKLAMTPLKSGQAEQLYRTGRSDPPLGNSVYGHTGIFSPPALLSKRPCH